MHFVYATRQLPKLKFDTANKLAAVPPEAEVFAVCDGPMTIRRQHEEAVDELTEQERSALEAIIAQSQILEANLARGTRVPDTSLQRLRSILGRIRNRKNA